MYEARQHCHWVCLEEYMSIAPPDRIYGRRIAVLQPLNRYQDIRKCQNQNADKVFRMATMSRTGGYKMYTREQW